MPKQSKADLKEAEREKLRAALLKEIGSETPFPDGPDDLKNKSSKWENVDFTNVHKIKKIVPTLTLEDVPTSRTFQEDGGKGGRSQVATYVRFLIEEHATQKRKATTHLDREEKKARGAFDLRFEGLDQDERHAAWRREIWNDKDKKVTLGQKKFRARTGPEVGADAFWDALKAEEKAAKVAKAKADGDVREMTRVVELPDAFKPGQPNDGAMPFGAGTEKMSGPWSIGDPECKYIISVVEKAATRRRVSLEDMGVDWARCLLKAARAREQKMRRVGMENNARCVTTALTTGRDFVLLGVEAVERGSSRLVAELRITAMANASEVSALGDSNRGGVRTCLTACGDAPSVGFGAAAGGVLGGGAASRGGLQSGRVGAARQRAAAVSDEAPASLGVAVEGYEWEGLVLGRASRLRSASRERVVTVLTDTGSAVSLDPTNPTFLVELARCASPKLDDVPAIRRLLDERELHETPGGEAGIVLLDYGLMRIDPLTGKGVAGGFIGTCEAIDKEEMGRQGLAANGKFYAPKIMHLALQKALVSGKLHFERDLLTLFYCIFGKLFYALTFWAGGVTWLKARDMGFDPTLVPLELPPEDLPKLESSIAKRFPKGIVIESSDDLYPILLATNQKFFDQGKCFLWALAFAAYYGAGHPRARAALAAVATYEKDHERAALRVAACEKAIAALATGGGAGVSAVGAAACGDVLVAAPASAPKFPSLKAACDAAVTPFEFQIRFAVPAKGPGEPSMTKWYSIGDFAPVMRVLSSYSNWESVRLHAPWVVESETCRAMEAAACASSAVFAGMHITEIAPPHSVAHVFDPTKECKHDQTYTIWAGVDFEIMLPGGTIISKSEFLLQELEKYMAARV